MQNKQHSKSIKLVKRQYIRAVGGLVKGIGIVNLVHTNGNEHYPIDYRIYAKEADGKTFKLVAKNGDIDWLITNNLSDTFTRASS